METLSLVTLVFAATVHLVMAAVLALYSRYKVEYLSLSWIMGIFGALFCVAAPFYAYLRFENIGLMNPAMLLSLSITSYFQTIYPLGIAMPGYLQWGRMWGYASPLIVLILLHVLSLFCAGRPVIILSYDDLMDHLFDLSMLFR